jgi:hypothetical protein
MCFVDSEEFRNRHLRISENPLYTSLKDDTVQMDDSNKYTVTGQMNLQTADPKSNVSVFNFFLSFNL